MSQTGDRGRSPRHSARQVDPSSQTSRTKTRVQQGRASSAQGRVSSRQGNSTRTERSAQAASHARPSNSRTAARKTSNANSRVRDERNARSSRKPPARKASRVKLLIVALCAVTVLALGAFGVDRLLNADKIYKGVSVGEVDVSGMTVNEASFAVEDHYREKLLSSQVVVYADEDLVGKVDVRTEILEEEALADQISVEAARENKQIWLVTAESLGASVASRELAEQSFQVGREDGGIFARLGAMLFGKDIPIRCDYDESLLDELVLDIDETLGAPRIDSDIVIEDGEARVVPGQDGDCMDRETFVAQLDTALLISEAQDAWLVAKVAPSPMRISAEQAQAACDYVNQILSTEVSFACDGEGWGISRSALARWISTEVTPLGKAFALDLRIDADLAKPAIVAFTNEQMGKRDVVVGFAKSNGQISVITDGEVELPLVEDAILSLDEALFGTYRDNVGIPHNVDLASTAYVADNLELVQVTIRKGTVPEELPFEEALDLGLITSVSSFTTTYNNNESTQNRVHNIHLAADLITDGIVESGGGTWSFNDRAGNCDASKGFLGAGVIVNDELTDAVGGGICQVATTVFNAVYDGGYGITRRHNHTLFLEAYPAGRDAAVSYPDLDLVWQNDTDSDVLIRCSYSDDSLTVTLYSVDPGYEVTHVDGEWRKTKDHATKKEVDETLSSGQSYVETEGTDAMQFAVFRTVTDAAGNVVYDDAFYSSYGSVTEVIRVAPDYKETEGKGADGQDDQD